MTQAKLFHLPAQGGLEGAIAWWLHEHGWRPWYDEDGGEWWAEDWEWTFSEPPSERESGVDMAEAFATTCQWARDTQRFTRHTEQELNDALEKAHICRSFMGSHRVRRWRTWRATMWLMGKLYTSGLTCGGGSYTGGAGWDTWHVCSLPRLRGKRSYFLGVKREWYEAAYWCIWRRLRGRERPHWPKMVRGIGCGICCPWPCCGSTDYDHAEGCTGGD